jgi:hypothetical protein
MLAAVGFHFMCVHICCAGSQGRFLSRSSYPANSRRSRLSVLMHNPVLGMGCRGSARRSSNRPSRTRLPLPGSPTLHRCSRRANSPRDVNATPRSVTEAGSPVGLAAWFALSIAKSGAREDKTAELDGAEREVRTDPTRATPAAPRTSARTKNTLGIPMNAPLGRGSATPRIRPLPLPAPPMFLLHASSTAAREPIVRNSEDELSFVSRIIARAGEKLGRHSVRCSGPLTGSCGQGACQSAT